MTGTISTRTFIISLFSLMLSAAACGGSSPSNPNEGGDPGPSPETPSNCPGRCAAKTAACGIDSRACTEICAQIVREAQLQCLEAADCTEDAASKCRSAGNTPDASAPPPSGPNKPAELTVSAKFGDGVEVHHVLVDDTKDVFTTLSMTPKPVFSPSTPDEMPDITNAPGIAISSPDLGQCDGRFSWTLNRDQLGLSFTGTDKGTANDCANFADKVAANGMNAVMANVPYPNGGKAKVTLALRK